MTQNKIKNVIFDVGNVLLEFKPKLYLEKIFDHQKTREDIYEVVFASDEWIELDKGTLSEEEALEIFISKTPHLEKELKLLWSNWHDIFEPIEDNISVLRFLSENGYQLFVLSNFHKKAFEVVEKRYDFFDLFHGKTVSGFINQLKPDYEIYHTVLNDHNLTPHETVFIDDTEKNIKAAKELNIHGIHLTKDMDLKSMIHELLEMD